MISLKNYQKWFIMSPIFANCLNVKHCEILTDKRVEEVVDKANPAVSQKILGDAEPKTSTKSSPNEHLLMYS